MKQIINDFINSIDTKLYSRIRASKGDAECRRYLKEHLQEKLTIHSVSKRFDFDKLLQDYRQEFVNGGGYVKSDTFEIGTEPYEVFEWFKKKLS